MSHIDTVRHLVTIYTEVGCDENGPHCAIGITVKAAHLIWGRT